MSQLEQQQNRTGTSIRTRNSNESARPTITTPTSPSSPRVRFSNDPTPPSPGGTQKSALSQSQTGGAKTRPPRVIRTFEEIDRIVPREEWYEELECGICSHILGAPQGLVPCGHSFCGPCAWTWIKVNGNHTCPHCRVPVNETIPLIPNIVVDQIIDRKLAGLPDGKEKEGHILERDTKSADWKILQSSIVPPKPAPTPRRSGRAMEIMNNLFEPMPHHRRPRRSTIETFAEPEDEPEPDARRRSVYAGMSLAEASRRHVEDDPTNIRHQSAARRLGTTTTGTSADQSHGGYEQFGGIQSRESIRPRMPTRTSSNGSTLEQHRLRQIEDVPRAFGAGSSTLGTTYETNYNVNNEQGRRDRPNLQVRTGSNQHFNPDGNGNGNGNGVRRSITTSRALLSRQDRYRNGNTRDNAVLVVSDSD